MAKQLAGITGQLYPDLSRKAVIVMAGDHGVCEEGVSAFPSEVTPQMVLNFLNGGAAVNVLARQVGADVVCVDVGVNADLSHPSLVSRKVRKGTANMAQGPAMTREEAIAAIAAGFDLTGELAARGYRLFAAGEMGIGNTTASSAILSVLGATDTVQATGAGPALTTCGWRISRTSFAGRSSGIGRMPTIRSTCWRRWAGWRSPGLSASFSGPPGIAARS